MKILRTFFKNKVSALNRTIISFGISNFLILISNSVAGILILKYITPQDFGVYNKFLIVANYVALLNLGIPVVLQSKLPGLLKIKSHSEVAKLVNSSFSYYLLILMPITLIFFVCFVYYILQMNFLISTCFLIVIVNIWQTLFQNKFLKILYRTGDEFKTLVKIQNKSSVISLFSSIFIIFFKIGGILIKNFIYTLYNIIYLIKFSPLKFKFEYEEIKKLISQGFKYFRVNILYAYFPILISSFSAIIFEAEEFGLLSLYFLIIATLNKLLVSIDKILYIQISEKFFLKQNPNEIFNKLFRSNILPFILVYLFISIIIIFNVDHVISNYFPLYKDGTMIIKLTFILGIFLMFNFQNIFFDVFKKLKFKFYSISIKYLVFISGLMFILYLDNLTIVNILYLIMLSEFFSIVFNFYIIKLKLND